MKCFLLGLCVTAAGVSVTARCPAQTTRTTPATAAADAPPVVRLSLTPAAPGALPLTYRLLPSLSDCTPGDAAPLYLLACQLAAPPAGPKDTDPWAQVMAWLKLPDQLPRADVRKLLDGYAGALRNVDLAARREECHWALPIREEGFSTLLPHLNGLRAIARLLALRARLQVADHDFAGAAHTLQTGFALARHLDEEAVLIQTLVGVAIESTLLEQVEQWVGTPGAPNLYWSLCDLPSPFFDARSAMEREHAIVAWSLPQLADAAAGRITAEQWQRLVATMRGPGRVDAGRLGLPDLVAGTKDLPDARRFLREAGVTEHDLAAMESFQILAAYYARNYERWWQETAKWFTLPYSVGRPGLDAAEEAWKRDTRGGRGGPLTEVMPAVGRAAFMIARPNRTVAALRCVEAIRAYAAAHAGTLPPSLDAIQELPVPQDPLTGGAFVYAVHDRSATLTTPAPPSHPEHDSLRYELEIRNAAADEHR